MNSSLITAFALLQKFWYVVFFFYFVFLFHAGRVAVMEMHSLQERICREVCCQLTNFRCNTFLINCSVWTEDISLGNSSQLLNMMRLRMFQPSRLLQWAIFALKLAETLGSCATQSDSFYLALPTQSLFLPPLLSHISVLHLSLKTPCLLLFRLIFPLHKCYLNKSCALLTPSGACFPEDPDWHRSFLHLSGDPCSAICI